MNTNLVKFAESSKAEVLQQPQFIHKFKVECYFRDRTKKLFEFEKESNHKIMYPELEQFQVDCFQTIYAEVDRGNLLMTWPKSYVKLPSGEIKPGLELLPSLHFGLVTMDCYI